MIRILIADFDAPRQKSLLQQRWEFLLGKRTWDNQPAGAKSRLVSGIAESVAYLLDFNFGRGRGLYIC